MTAAELIRNRRTALGLSQAELAARAGTGQAFVSRVESGRTTPTLPVLQRLAAALDCDVVLDLEPHR
ncbi:MULTISPECIES: helix-turn-helix domain-containing protein [Streptacidiphilus]|uniref:Helix-turn-helix domain-containing protein n=1 Tax=Streptacidiphilus cavernicola TaxID=3342716 RepID=A0ABV6UNJ0_9ACTN|nr:helix-turn-helix transcriptional regulator [Streptacidiphilus jeojiense]